jgi:hypothetical protein
VSEVGPIRQFRHLKRAGTRSGYNGANVTLRSADGADEQQHRSTGRKPRTGSPPRQWRSVFLTALAACGNVSLAARAACVNRDTAYEHRRRDFDFAARWADAIEEASDALEAEARRRAVDGVNEPVVYQGELMGVWVGTDGKPATKDAEGARFIPLTLKKYSDVLLIFLLKGNRPDKYRERIGIGGDQDAPPVKVERAGEVALVQRLDALTDAFARAAAREEGGGVPDDGAEESVDS